jgi:hypothetical protein
MAKLAVSVADVLGLDVAGVDILFDKDGYRICEANSSPGSRSRESVRHQRARSDLQRDGRQIRLALRARRTPWQRAVDSCAWHSTGAGCLNSAALRAA